MPIATVRLCSDQLRGRFSGDDVMIKCVVLLIAFFEVSIFCQFLYRIFLYGTLVRISSPMGCQIAIENFLPNVLSGMLCLTKTRRRKGL